jgi:hypothetical protein
MPKTSPFLVAITVLNAAFAMVSISQAQGTSAAVDVVRARMLQIVDAQGRVRASIQVHPANPREEDAVVLRLINTDGKPAVKLAASDHSVGLALIAEQGNYVQLFPEGAKVTKGGKLQASWP